MKCLRIILYDQLSHNISSLEGVSRSEDIVLMVELHSEFTYIKLDDKNNKKSLEGHVNEIIKNNSIVKVIITKPSEYRVFSEINLWKDSLSIPICITEDNRFLCTTNKFNEWAQNKKQLKMEFFYRQMRVQYNILMHNNRRAPAILIVAQQLLKLSRSRELKLAHLIIYTGIF